MPARAVWRGSAQDLAKLGQQRPKRNPAALLDLGEMVAVNHRQGVDPAADRGIGGACASGVVALRPWMLSRDAITWRLFFTR